MVDKRNNSAKRWLRRLQIPAAGDGRWGVLAGMQQPFEVFLLMVSILAGLAFLTGVRAPTSLEQTLPASLVTVWFTVLLSSGVIGLLGCFWLGNVITGLLLERSAMLFAAAAGLIYSVGLFTNAGWGATGAAMYVIAYTVACLVRVGGITSTLFRLYRLGG